MAIGNIWRWIKRAAILALGFAAFYAADYVSFNDSLPCEQDFVFNDRDKCVLPDAA
jgi:hypothetical protein